MIINIEKIREKKKAETARDGIRAHPGGDSNAFRALPGDAGGTEKPRRPRGLSFQYRAAGRHDCSRPRRG